MSNKVFTVQHASASGCCFRCRSTSIVHVVMCCGAYVDVSLSKIFSWFHYSVLIHSCDSVLTSLTKESWDQCKKYVYIYRPTNVFTKTIYTEKINNACSQDYDMYKTLYNIMPCAHCHTWHLTFFATALQSMQWYLSDTLRRFRDDSVSCVLELLPFVVRTTLEVENSARFHN